MLYTEHVLRIEALNYVENIKISFSIINIYSRIFLISITEVAA